jgi:hypothetical protein
VEGSLFPNWEGEPQNASKRLKEAGKKVQTVFKKWRDKGLL